MNDGRKDDKGKPDWNLVPWKAMDEVVKVLTHGAKKYGGDNWKRVSGLDRRYFAAAVRHMVKWREGNHGDHESGCSHLAHALCCLLFMLEAEKEQK